MSFSLRVMWLIETPQVTGRPRALAERMTARLSAQVMLEAW